MKPYGAEVKIICPHCGKRSLYFDTLPDAIGRTINRECQACTHTAEPDETRAADLYGNWSNAKRGNL